MGILFSALGELWTELPNNLRPRPAIVDQEQLTFSETLLQISNNI